MNLYACYFIPFELPLCPDIVNMVICYPAEYSSQASAYSGLLAVEYRVVSYNVGAYSFFGPAILQSPGDDFIIELGAVFAWILGANIVPAFSLSFCPALPPYIWITDNIVFDNPSLTPVRTDKTKSVLP